LALGVFSFRGGGYGGEAGEAAAFQHWAAAGGERGEGGTQHGRCMANAIGKGVVMGRQVEGRR